MAIKKNITNWQSLNEIVIYSPDIIEPESIELFVRKNTWITIQLLVKLFK